MDPAPPSTTKSWSIHTRREITSKYEIQNRIGSGAYSDVYKARRLWSEDEDAVLELEYLPTDLASVIRTAKKEWLMRKEQLIEFGWGLASSKKDFLWITRPDIVGDDEAMMPSEFVDETKGRGCFSLPVFSPSEIWIIVFVVRVILRCTAIEGKLIKGRRLWCRRWRMLLTIGIFSHHLFRFECVQLCTSSAL
ncbi:hypothetical protein L1887_35774 [Cichorium endivia]|nr:hypothetical protein L1887_35774 [Cichorium endivia]